MVFKNLHQLYISKEKMCKDGEVIGPVSSPHSKEGRLRAE